MAFVMERFGHVSIEMTAHYLQLERDEIRDIWAKAVIGPNARIAGKRARAISGAMAERFKGKTAEEVDAIVSELSESMTFNPLPTGVCLYDVRRGPCPDGESCIFYDCPNFVTDERFLPVLRRELDLLGMEMARLKSAGMEREWQRQYARARHLRPLVEQLEESEAEDER